MLNPGANVPVLSQSLVGEYKMPVVVWERSEIINSFEHTDSKCTGTADTFTCTLRLADHYRNETFEVYPLLDNHNILMPWWWSLQHLIRYINSGPQSDIWFDSPKCVNCIMSAITEFSIDYDESAKYFGKEEKWIGVMGSLRIEEE